MKKLLSGFVAVSLFCCMLCSCKQQMDESVSDTAETSVSAGQSSDESSLSCDQVKHVLFIYMCGNTLESGGGSASKNITEILHSDIPKKAEIVIQTGGAKRWHGHDISADESCRYLVRDGKLQSVWKSEPVNMGLASSLSDFLLWGIEQYPAERYSLVLWNHGGGSVGGVCYDEQFHNDSLSLSEIDKALCAATDCLGKKLELVGFDSCMMATLDTAFIVSRYADNMIASQELEPSGGWDYRSLAENLLSEELYNAILSGYSDKHKSNDCYTLSHVDFSKFDELVSCLDSFIDTVSRDDSLRTLVTALDNAHSFGMSVRGSDFYDLGNLVEYYGLGEGLTNCVTAVNGESKEDASGLSIFFPLNAPDKTEQYIQISPIEKYSDLIEAFYEERNNQIISFLSYAQIVDNKLSMRFTDNSLQYLQSIKYKLYKIEEDGEKERLFYLGTDNDTNQTGSTVTVNFNGRWVRFGEEWLSCEVIDKTDDVTIFVTPALVNSKEAYIIFSYNALSRETELIGVTYRTEYGRIHSVEYGTQVYPARCELTDDGAVLSYSENGCIYDENTRITVDVLEDGYYQYTAIPIDVYGNEYIAGTAIVSIKDGKATLEAVTADRVDI